MKNTIQTLIVGGMLAVAVARPVHATALLKPSRGDTQALSAKSLSIDSKISGAFAKTTLTTVYKNPNTLRIEADFMYSAPEGAVVTGFAYWFGEEKVVARVVEKGRAARIYQYITTRQKDPALIEMVGKNTFRARIFPVEANQDLKIEIQLAQTLESTPNGLKWHYPLQEETKEGALEKFDLNVEVDGKATSNLGEFSNSKLDLQRENFKAQSDLSIEVAQNRAPLRVSLLARRESSAGDGFFALSIVPSTPIPAPRFKINGGSTYEVLVPTMKRLEVGAPFLVFGRYKGTGKAVVALNNQSVALDFGADVEQNNVASKLWAQKRIETLSENEKNRFQVVNISSRFGIVSKWTSWLAIPSAERKRFQREVDYADRQNAGRAYAQAMARGDKKTANAQKVIFADLNKKLGEKVQLSDWLNSELEIVSNLIDSAKYDKSLRPQIAGWQKTRQALIRLGARKPQNSYHDYQRMSKEIGALVPIYLSEVENGKANGLRARRIKNRLVALSNSDAMQTYGGGYEDNLQSEVHKRGEVLAEMLAAERAERRLKPGREANLILRLKRILPLTEEYSRGDLQDVLQEGQWSVVSQKTSRTRKQVAQQVKNGLPYAQALSKVETEWNLWERKVGGHNLSKRDAHSELKIALEDRLASEVLAKRELQPNNLQLATDLNILNKNLNESMGWKLRGAYDTRAKTTAKELIKEQVKNGTLTPRAIELEKELDRLTINEKTRRTNIIAQANGQEKASVLDDLVPHVLNNTEDSIDGLALQKRLEKIKSLPSGSSNGYYDNYSHYRSISSYTDAWKGRAHETAYKLLEAQEKQPEKVAELQALLDKQAIDANNSSESFLSWEKYRRDAGEPMLLAQEYYRVRPGDPLISVVAPQNSRQVVAILPSGEVKTLVWNTANKAFEARFDVPAHATEGDYAVQIIIVGSNNMRSRLTLHFAVDSSAPDGKGHFVFENGTAKIRLESDENTDRVSAFLPWNERVELRRGENGIFGGELPVPAEWQNREVSVRFVLTDKAHNRSEIWVSP